MLFLVANSLFALCCRPQTSLVLQHDRHGRSSVTRARLACMQPGGEEAEQGTRPKKCKASAAHVLEFDATQRHLQLGARTHGSPQGPPSSGPAIFLYQAARLSPRPPAAPQAAWCGGGRGQGPQRGRRKYTCQLCQYAGRQIGTEHPGIGWLRARSAVHGLVPQVLQGATGR